MKSDEGKPAETLDTCLAELGMTQETIGTVTADGPSAVPIPVRVLLPDWKHGGWIERALLLGAAEHHWGELLPRAAALTRLWFVALDPHRRHLRHLGPLSLWRTPSLKIRRQLPSDRLPAVIQYLGQESHLSDEELLETALYPRPLTAAFEDPRYEDVSTQVLLELEDVIDAIDLDKLMQEVRPDLEARVASALPKLTDEERQSMVETLSEQLTAEAWPKVVRILLKHSAGNDKRDSAFLEPLALRATHLLDDHPEWEEPSTHLVPIHEFLDQAIACLRTNAAHHDDWWSRTAQHLQTIRDEDDLEDKLAVIHEIALTFLPRAELVSALLREADAAPSFILGQAAKSVYRKVRNYLSPAERRLFCLMYMPCWRGLGSYGRCTFNGWSLLQHPLLYLLLLDDEMLQLTLEVIAFKHGGDDAEQRLRLQYRKVVSFYGWWIRILREQENQRKKTARWTGRRKHLHDADATIPQPFNDPDAQFDVSRFFEDAIRAAEATRPLKRHRIARLYLLEGRSEAEIARITGTSQQNVSKALREFLRADIASALSTSGRRLLDRCLTKGKHLSRTLGLERGS
jgi:hypothetical protein